MVGGKMPYEKSSKGSAKAKGRGRSRSDRRIGLTVTTVANENCSVNLDEATLDPVFMGGSGDEEANSNDNGNGNSKARCCKKSSVKSYRALFGIGFLLFLILNGVLLYVFLAPRNKTTTGDSSSVIVNPNNDYTNDSPEDDSSEDEPATIMPTFSSTGSSTWTSSWVTTEEETKTFDNSVFDPVIYTANGLVELLETVPHDTKAFTQGVEILSHQKIEIMKGLATSSSIVLDQSTIRPKNFLSSYALEATGRKNGKSGLRIVALATGDVVQQLNEEYFGGGCTYYYEPNKNDDSVDGVVRVVQLTLDKGRGFVYDLSMPTTQTPEWSLSLIGDFEFASDTSNGQGWGIVYHPLRNQFIVSDGSNFLHFWKLTQRVTFTFTETGSLTTFDFDFVEKIRVKERRIATQAANWTRVRRVNELEWDPYYHGGNTILANILNTNEIMRIWVGLPEEDNTNNINDNIFVDDSSSKSKNHEENLGKVTHVYDLSFLEELAEPTS
jgi:glutamine cyclotransferase